MSEYMNKTYVFHQFRKRCAPPELLCALAYWRMSLMHQLASDMIEDN